MNNSSSSGYVEPPIYSGNQIATTMYSKTNATHFSYTFRCQNCMNWGDRGFDPTVFAVMGWAQSFSPVADITNPGSSIIQHDNGFGQYGVDLPNARQAQYEAWIAGAGTPTDPPPATTTVAAPTVTPTSGTVLGTYDYIVVGGGAAGLVGL